MNRFILTAIFLVSTNTMAVADDFVVGSMKLSVPAPEGFVRVTPEMRTVYEFTQKTKDPLNDTLANYIPEAIVPEAKTGAYPNSNRNFILKVNKELKEIRFGEEQFAEFRAMTKQQNEKFAEQVQEKIKAHFDKISKDLSGEAGVDLSLQVTQIVPLAPHYETDNAISYSMYINYGTSVDGVVNEEVVAATAMFINTAGKVLFLYSYAPKDDLEWTRKASEAWAQAVLSSNGPPPSLQASSGDGIDWGNVIQKGIVGALVGGLFALIFGGISRLTGREKK